MFRSRTRNMYILLYDGRFSGRRFIILLEVLSSIDNEIMIYFTFKHHKRFTSV